MRPSLLLSFALLSTAMAAPAGWKLEWSDEFDQAGAPDPAKWTYEVGMIRNNETQFYTKDRRENARVEDGVLIIEARKEKRDGADFTSASLISKGRKDWTAGRFEIRAKLPEARGTWPAIWMLPLDHGAIPWPRCGEIDLMEHVGHDPGRIHATLHSETYNHIRKNQRSGATLLPDFSSDFHVYAMEWTQGRIVMQVDGKTIAEFEKKPGDTDKEWPFEKPFYLILNLAIGGSWGGAKGVDEAAFPQRMEVDYVRVYQKS
ncbi:MAG: glycoside hydrolase family 16 protein [Akkermansiaceae bacterium]|jgi:beta-glucanase (GH16 family)|nr:glycoside hydrolase family 16 protein [Akkermansiaceae bacterium]